eukprot:2064108-Rhodomonas_salina.1
MAPYAITVPGVPMRSQYRTPNSARHPQRSLNGRSVPHTPRRGRMGTLRNLQNSASQVSTLRVPARYPRYLAQGPRSYQPRPPCAQRNTLTASFP